MEIQFLAACGHENYRQNFQQKACYLFI